jgi:hypothetical protein
MLLVHLLGGRPIEESDNAEEASKMLAQGVFMNPTLGSKTGLLGGILELRREELDGGGSRYRMWYDGKPMKRQEEEVSE